MPELQPPAWLRSWAATLVTSSMFGAFGVSIGGLLGLVALIKGVNPWPWFTLGTCIPPGIMALVYTTDFMFERRLKTLKRWKDDGIITPELYDEQLKVAMQWRASRLYGIAVKPAGRSRPKPLPKKVEVTKLPESQEPPQALAEPMK